MFACFGITIPLGEAEINYVNNVLLFTMSNQEVVRLHISVDEVIIVEELKPLNHLVGNHERSLNSKLTLTEVEGVLKTWTEEIHNHCVVVALDTEPMDCWNTS